MKTKKQDFKKQYTIFKKQPASIDTAKKSYISRSEGIFSFSASNSFIIGKNLFFLYCEKYFNNPKTAQTT